MPDDVTILAIDPDPTVLSFIRRVALSAGYGFSGSRRAEDVLRKAQVLRPAAVVMRVSLPDMSGLELVTLLRRDAEPGGSASAAPILLTALRGQEEEVSAGLELGAVNVLFFPFTEIEFTTRLGAMLRWAKRPRSESILNLGPVSVDLERGELLRPEAHSLTASELEIMRWLLNPPGRDVTRRQIPVGTERAVDVHVAALRSKLGSAGSCIETIRGIGYRFKSAACL